AAALVVSLPGQKPGAHYTLAFDHNLAAFLEHEIVFQPAMDLLRHLDFALDPGGLHARGHIDCVAPPVIEKPSGSDDPCDHRTCAKPDPQRHSPSARIGKAGDRLGHAQREACQRLQMVLAALGNTAHHDVAVTAGLDLLQAMALDQSIKI